MARTVSPAQIFPAIAGGLALVVAGALALAPLPPHPALAAEPGKLTVVELFTSQGCSSCPPADANLAAIADRPDVLALSFGVTYWDSLGWKDTFARPAFTERQKSYEFGLKQPSPFTPQIVVDGRADVVGVNRPELERLIARERLSGGPQITMRGDSVSVGAAQPPHGGGADVWLVRYDPATVQVPIKRGENGGRTLPLKHVVRQLVKLGRWNGHAAVFHATAAAAGLKTAVLVQEPSGGPILSALKL
jgi:hypothetical protein